MYKTASQPATTPTKDSKRVHLHASPPLIAQPEVAANSSQSYTVEATHSNTMLTSGVTQPTLAAGNSTSFSHNKTKPCNDSQHSVVESTKGILYPYNAEYLIDHVLYLPVHKNVPLWYLDYLCAAVDKVMKNRPGVQFKNGKKTVILPSKL